MALYKTVRPQDFKQMRGNAAVIEVVSNLITKPDHPHSWGIFGPSGTGKTTLARIIAKELGASDISVKEINSSNNRGIDTAREIQEAIRFRSPDGAPVVYIIDECHKTTKDWQEAMLKPLEDYPAHVYFFLCTTEPDKLIKAIHTRLTRLDMAPLTDDEMHKLVKSTAKKEKITLTQNVLDKIVECAGGSPRQALVYLEGVSAVDDEKLQIQTITTSDDAMVDSIELCRTLLNDKSGWKDISEIIGRLDKEDPERLRRGILGYMNSVLLKSGKIRAGVIMQAFSEPTFNTGFAGITLAAFTAFNELNG